MSKLTTEEVQIVINMINQNMRNYDKNINLRMQQSDKIEMDMAKQQCKRFKSEMEDFKRDKPERKYKSMVKKR